MTRSWIGLLTYAFVASSGANKLHSQSLADTTSPRVAPSPAEREIQVQAATALDTAGQQYSAVDTRIITLERQIDSLRRVGAEASDALAQLQRARDEEESERQKRENVLRQNTIPEWMGNIKGLDAGLSSAAAGLRVAEITLIYRPGESAAWSQVLEQGGRGVASLGGVAAIFLSDDSQRTDALRVSAAGLALHLLGNWAISATRKRGGDLNTFVERVSMHRTFASDVLALSRSVTNVQSALAPVVDDATRYMSINSNDPRYECKAVAFAVTDSLVTIYAAVVESYDGLISQLLIVHNKARELRNQQWAAPISASLDTLIAKTDTAIAKWREQALVSDNLLMNLRTLARLDARTPRPVCPTATASATSDQQISIGRSRDERISNARVVQTQHTLSSAFAHPRGGTESRGP